MIVARELFNRDDAGAGFEQALDCGRVADADGVAERDFVAAHLEQRLRDAG